MLLITNQVEEKTLPLTKTAIALGYDVWSEGWNPPEYIKYRATCMYGGEFFCEVIAKQMNWHVLVNPSDWLLSLPKKYLNREIFKSTLGDCRKFNFSVPKIVKSLSKDDNLDFFTKKIESNADLPLQVYQDDTAVMVSDVLNFTSKYRCFVYNRRVAAVCCFKKIDEKNNKANYLFNNKEVISFVNSMLEDKEVKSVHSTVIDVGKYAKGDSFAVINSKNPCLTNIYGCELVGALQTIKSVCVKREDYV